MELIEIHDQYLKKLISSFEKLPKAKKGKGLDKLIDLQTNLETLKSDVSIITNKINKEFVDKLNSKEIEDKFSLEERSRANDKFKANCKNIVMKFSKELLT
jgi:hypothetical protein